MNPNGNSTAEKFKFQGQELEEELGKNTYAYQWRDYDPALGRFNKIDRFAEKYQSMTPYHFTANNPIRFVEIAGDSITPVGDIQYSKFNVDRSRGIDGGNKYQLYGFTGTTGGKDVQGFVASYQRKSGYRDDYIVDTESVGEFLETSKTQATIANLKEWAGGSGGSLWSRYKSTWTPMNVMTGLTIGMGSSLALASSRKSVPLYHYTSEAGYNSIMKSRTLNPSIGAKNARFGTGQYFTDIQPGSMTMGQTSYRLYGVPWNRTRLTHYIEIDTRGLNIINNKQFNYLNPSSSPLDLGGRILGGGKTPF